MHSIRLKRNELNKKFPIEITDNKKGSYCYTLLKIQFVLERLHKQFPEKLDFDFKFAADGCNSKSNNNISIFNSALV